MSHRIITGIAELSHRFCRSAASTYQGMAEEGMLEKASDSDLHTTEKATFIPVCPPVCLSAPSLPPAFVPPAKSLEA